MPGSNAPPGPGASSNSSSRMVRWISVVSVVAASVAVRGCADRDVSFANFADFINFNFLVFGWVVVVVNVVFDGGLLSGVELLLAAAAATAAAAGAVTAAGTHPQDVSLLQRCLFMAELHESRLPVPQPVGLLTIEIRLHVEHHHSSTAPGPAFGVLFSWFICLTRFT